MSSSGALLPNRENMKSESALLPDIRLKTVVTVKGETVENPYEGWRILPT